MICDCEVYEICPSCAPDEPTYTKATAANDEAARRRSESLSPSYTLAEMETLIREWLSTTPIPASGDLTRELVASNLLAWLARKEREAKDVR